MNLKICFTVTVVQQETVGTAGQNGSWATLDAYVVPGSRVAELLTAARLLPSQYVYTEFPLI